MDGVKDEARQPASVDGEKDEARQPASVDGGEDEARQPASVDGEKDDDGAVVKLTVCNKNGSRQSGV